MANQNPGMLKPLHSARRRYVVCCVLAMGIALTALACGQPARSGGVLGGSQHLLTRADMEAVNVSNVYQAVDRLRPDWMRGRGPNPGGNPLGNMPVIYVGGVRQQGGPTVLRNIRVEEVVEVRYLSGVDATTRYGTDHAAGAILVTVR
jgi:hypothetical protein